MVQRKPTTENGKRLLALVLELHGSVSKAARKADVSRETITRRIYGVPAAISNETISKLESVGLPRALLLPE